MCIGKTVRIEQTGSRAGFFFRKYNDCFFSQSTSGEFCQIINSARVNDQNCPLCNGKKDGRKSAVSCQAQLAQKKSDRYQDMSMSSNKTSNTILKAVALEYDGKN